MLRPAIIIAAALAVPSITAVADDRDVPVSVVATCLESTCLVSTPSHREGTTVELVLPDAVRLIKDVAKGKAKGKSRGTKIQIGGSSYTAVTCANDPLALCAQGVDPADLHSLVVGKRSWKVVELEDLLGSGQRIGPAPGAPEDDPAGCPGCAYGPDTEDDGAGLRFGTGAKAFASFDVLGPDTVDDEGQDDEGRAVTEPMAGSIVGTDVAAGPDVSEDVERTTTRGSLLDEVVLVGNADQYSCSGVLISTRHVITAAHCLPATTVAFGATLARATTVAVSSSSAHPDGADAAILTLENPVLVPFRERRRAGDDAPPIGTVRLAGFGVKDAARLTGFGVRRRVDIAVDGWGCDGKRARSVGCDPSLELLVADRRGNDTCFGDSGGAVLEQHDGGWRLLAITSRPMRRANRACGEGGIYVRTDAIDAWVTSILHAPLEGEVP